MSECKERPLHELDLAELMACVESDKLVEHWRASFPVQYPLPFETRGTARRRR